MFIPIPEQNQSNAPFKSESIQIRISLLVHDHEAVPTTIVAVS